MAAGLAQGAIIVFPILIAILMIVRLGDIRTLLTKISEDTAAIRRAFEKESDVL